MRQQGWATLAVMSACLMLAGATLSQNLMLTVRQSEVTQRLWSVQSLAAAEASIRITQAQTQTLATLPAQGCEQGRCAWMGAAGLARQLWLDMADRSGPCGALTGSAPPLDQWPTLPGVHIRCWIESTPAPQGHWLRLTALVQRPQAVASTLMQAVWLRPPDGGRGRWVSWREVMP
jgi:hypothetical protein